MAQPRKYTTYYPMTHAVGCDDHIGYAGEQLIAMFNCTEAAEAYALMCAKGRQMYTYRVLSRRATGQFRPTHIVDGKMQLQRWTS